MFNLSDSLLEALYLNLGSNLQEIKLQKPDVFFGLFWSDFGTTLGSVLAKSGASGALTQNKDIVVRKLQGILQFDFMFKILSSYLYACKKYVTRKIFA